MQILNISVMNRPTKSITSRPYSVLDISSTGIIATNFNGGISNYNTTERTGITVAVLDGLIREAVMKLPTDYEASTLTSSISNLQITYEVVYRDYTVEPEYAGSLTSSIVGLQITRQVAYLSTNVEPEYAGSLTASIVGLSL